MNRFRVALGVSMTAMGAAIFWGSNSWWGVRGAAYMVFGTLMVYYGLKEKE